MCTEADDQVPVLERLRARLSKLTRQETSHKWPSVQFDVPEIDRALPWYGLARGALHEVVGDEAASIGLVTVLLGRDARSKQILWISPYARLYAHGLAQLGLNDHRLTHVSTQRAENRLWVSEEGLRALGHGAVVLEIPSADLTETRRLQLVAEKSGSIGFLLRRDRQPSAASTRWHVMPVRSDGYRPRWRITLERCRGAEAGMSWDLEWDHAAFHLHMAATLANRSMAAAE